MSKLFVSLIALCFALTVVYAGTEINFNFEGLLGGAGYGHGGNGKGNDNGNGYGNGGYSHSYSHSYTPSPSPSPQFNLGGIQIIVGASNAPYLFPNLTGFTVDLFNLFGEKVNAVIKYVYLADDSSQNGLLNFHTGGFNVFTIPINVVADSTTITDARSAYITFADPYSVSYTTLMVLPTSTYGSLSAIQADTTAIVGALAGTTNLQTALDNFCAGVSCYRVTAYPSLTAELADLNSGAIDGIVSDSPQPGLIVPTGAGSLSIENEAAAFPKDDALVQIFNDVLAELQADGTLASLRAKYGISG